MGLTDRDTRPRLKACLLSSLRCRGVHIGPAHPCTRAFASDRRRWGYRTKVLKQARMQ